MLSGELRDLLRPVALVQRVIWWALTLPIGLYVVVAFVVADEMTRGTGLDAGPLAPVLCALSAAMAVLSMVLRRRALSKDRLRKLAAEDADPGEIALDARTKQLDPDRLRRLGALSPEDRKLMRLAASLIAPTLVSLALHEAIGIFGLVLALVGGDPPAIIPFAVAAVILNLFVYPRPERIVREAQGWIYVEAG